MTASPESRAPGSLDAMNVSLRPELRRFVERGVRSGRFRSASEALNAGLRLLREEERWRDDVKQKLEEGWAEAEAGLLLDGPTVMRELRAGLRRKRRVRSS